MKHGNPPERWEKIVSRFSEDALKAFEIFGCHEHRPCLPVDQNRIIFVTCKNSYVNRKRHSIFHPDMDMGVYGDEFQGNNKILIRCPLDCAVRGSAYDGGKRYDEIKERTKHIKLYQPIIFIKEFVSIWDRILNWIKRG